MSSFRERFGKLTVAQAIEMNNTASKYDKLCGWTPGCEYEIRKANDPDGEKMVAMFKRWADK